MPSNSTKTSDSFFDRPTDGHKGTFGKIGFLAGSRSMPGAAALSASACLRAGAGTATVFCPASAAAVIASVNPCVMTVGLPEDTKGRLHLQAIADLKKSFQKLDVLAIGPGWGQSFALQSILKMALSSFSGPIVIDADGLNALAELIRTARLIPSNLSDRQATDNLAPPIRTASHLLAPISLPPNRVFLTPHPGEFTRLASAWKEQLPANQYEGRLVNPVPLNRDEMEDLAKEFAAAFDCHLLLKGPDSLIVGATQQSKSLDLANSRSDRDLGDCAKPFFTHNNTGNSGMATAGSGDVLTGILAGILGGCSSNPEPNLLAFAAKIHGLAGDLAAEKLGKISLTANDLIEFLPMAINALEQETKY